jgi:gentisate 1,2-dioxygenase
MTGFDGMVPTINRLAEAGRADFYGRAAAEHLAPLWRVLHGLVTDAPASPCLPAFWPYEKIRPYLIEACDLISTEEAERRVLVLENPGMPGQSRITRSLFGGLQIVRPGEIAPAHRHVASALRFIIEGRDAYTAVGGERTSMAPGDFVITPSWAWHDHGNPSDAPMVWLDGLDMHIVNLLDASFREAYPEPTHPVSRPEGSAMAESGHNLLPIDQPTGRQTSPIFNYPYARTREALDGLARGRAPDSCHGHKMKFINPVTGGWAMPTISTAMQLLPEGFKTAPYRSTDGTVFVVVEGTGTSHIGGQRFDWRPHDIFVAPSWTFHEHEAASEAVIFSYSDRVVQEKLDIFREQRGNA